MPQDDAVGISGLTEEAAAVCPPSSAPGARTTMQRWFADHRVEYLRTYPSAVFGDTPEDLFTPAPDNWGLERWLTQIAWMGTLGREGGLFFPIGRKR